MKNLDEIFQEEELFLKNVMLTTEFNKYLVEHPEFVEKIPQDSVVILLPEDDPEFCQKLKKLIARHRKIDDESNRPIVYVKIERLRKAPPSRLINPSVQTIVA